MDISINKAFPFFSRAPAKAKPQQVEKPSELQIRQSSGTPFDTAFNQYSPLQNNLGLYRMIREALPICNQAIAILNQLVGVPKIETEDKRAQAIIDEFVTGVKVNSLGERGLSSYLYQLCDSAFALGGGVGEIRPTETKSRIHSLCNNRTENLSFKKIEGEWFYATKGMGQTQVIENPEMINYLAFDRRDGGPQGISLFYSLPFVTQIFIRMEQAIQNLAWRMGDPIFFVVVTGAENQVAAEVKATYENIRSSLQSSMQLRKMGQTADIAGGVPFGAQAEIRTVGADSKNTVLEVHIRAVEEQIVANTGIPPGLFGLSWSARETMLEGQTDILVSKINSYRGKLNPIIRQDVDTELLFNRMPGMEYDINWPVVNMQDDVKAAEARFNNAQARQIEISNIIQLVGMGVMTEEDGNQALLEKKLITRKPSKEWWSKAVKDMLVSKALKGIFYESE